MFSVSTRRGKAIAATVAALLAQGVHGATDSTRILESEAKAVNTLFHSFIFIICGSVALIVVCWRVLIVSVKHARLLACLTNDKQRYFLRPYQKYASLKKDLLYAPIFHKRHNRELQLSAAINMGILPTRLELLFLIAYLGTNIAFCVTRIHWNQPYSVVAVEVRHRSGILAVVNMDPLFIMSTRNNPFIYWLDMPFQSCNSLHHWFGRIVTLEMLLHALAWLISTAKLDGWSNVMNLIKTDPQLTWGLVVSAHSFAATSGNRDYKRPRSAVIATPSLISCAPNLPMHVYSL
jgi:hypothetical protein